MSYYKEVRDASKEIDNRMRSVLSGNELNISKTIIDITANYEVGEKVVLKRIQHYKKAFPNLKELDGILYYDPSGAN